MFFYDVEIQIYPHIRQTLYLPLGVLRELHFFFENVWIRMYPYVSQNSIVGCRGALVIHHFLIIFFCCGTVGVSLDASSIYELTYVLNGWHWKICIQHLEWFFVILSSSWCRAWSSTMARYVTVVIEFYFSLFSLQYAKLHVRSLCLLGFHCFPWTIDCFV